MSGLPEVGEQFLCTALQHERGEGMWRGREGRGCGEDKRGGDVERTRGEGMWRGREGRGRGEDEREGMWRGREGRGRHTCYRITH